MASEAFAPKPGHLHDNRRSWEPALMEIVSKKKKKSVLVLFLTNHRLFPPYNSRDTRITSVTLVTTREVCAGGCLIFFNQNTYPLSSKQNIAVYGLITVSIQRRGVRKMETE